jgi:phenylalanyl-tRNA synthetase beta chain
MPIVAIPVQMLSDRLGDPPLETPALVELLQRLGCDVDGYERVEQLRCRSCGALFEAGEAGEVTACEGCGREIRDPDSALDRVGEVEVVRIDLLPVRPDMLDPGGLARALRFFLGRTTEPARYSCAGPTISVTVDPVLAERTSYRPYIACAVVRDIPLTADLIPVVMKLQENLHWAMGRDRKLASIGVYDLSTLSGDEFVFRAAAPDELSFVPLMCDPEAPESMMTPAQVLERHPKGVAYAHLLANHQRYPLLADGQGQVLSMPPIINSEATRVHEGTRDLFIDVTGLSERLVQRTLIVAATSLLELVPQARLEQARIRYSDREIITPQLEPDRHRLEPAAAAKLIGIPLTTGDTAALLTKMGHGVQVDDGALQIDVPAYRNDVMHEVDLIEDVAMAYGYHAVPPTLVQTLTVGQARPIEELSNTVRRAMTGLGLFEVVNLPLTSPEVCFDALRLERQQHYVEIANPVSVEQTMLRTSLLAGLLGTLGNNIHRELPQRIFEVGDVTFLDGEAETGARETRYLAAALAGVRVSLADVWALAEALCREIGLKLVVSPEDSDVRSLWLRGRATAIRAVGPQVPETAVGVIGEVHPAVLEYFGIRAATALMELNLDLFACGAKSS